MKASTKLQYSMNCTLSEARAFICKLKTFRSFRYFWYFTLLLVFSGSLEEKSRFDFRLRWCFVDISDYQVFIIYHYMGSDPLISFLASSHNHYLHTSWSYSSQPSLVSLGQKLNDNSIRKNWKFCSKKLFIWSYSHVY